MRAILVGLVLGCWATSLGAAPAPGILGNQLANPGFDVGTSSWLLANYSPAWQPVDANSSPRSGSLRVSLRAGGSLAGAIAFQCVPAPANTTMSLTAWVRASVTEVLPTLGWWAYASNDCSGAQLRTEVISSGTAAHGWEPVGATFMTPAGTHSVRVDLIGARNAGATAQTLEFDDVDLELAAPSTCVPDDLTLCTSRAAGDLRFITRAQFVHSPSAATKINSTGSAHAISLESLGVAQGGVFWFFFQANPELLVKVLDGCEMTHHFWVFAAAGTDVGVELHVGDTATGRWYLFHSPEGAKFPTIQNTNALPCD